MLLKQSFIEKIYRQLGFRKSNSESNFESLKAEVLSILKKQAEKEHNEIKKALKEVDNYFYFEKTLDGKIIQKAGYPVGTVREWKGKKYIKVAPKMWKRQYNKNDRGASISAGKLIKKVEQCKTVEDLMQLVLANKQRFSDENGRPLPIVDKIRAAVDKKNDSFDSETKTVKAPKIEVSESDKKMYYNNASYKYAEIMSSRKIKDIKEGYSKLKDLIQRKKDLFESNKKDIEAGKDSNNKLKTYNAHYEIEIAEYEKIANKVKEYIDSKSKKKETPKTENNSKWEKLSKDEKENKISEYAQNLVNNTDRYSIKDYENLIESIESNKKNLIGGGDDIPKSERINIIKTAMLSLQKESEAEKHANRSEGMKGNQNAKKDGYFGDEEKVKLVKKLKGEVFESYNTNPSIFARYYNKETNKATGLYMTQEIANIINSHKEPGVLDWKENIAKEINSKYPEIDKLYIEQNLTALRMGYRNGKKENVLIAPNKTESKDSKEEVSENSQTTNLKTSLSEEEIKEKFNNAKVFTEDEMSNFTEENYIKAFDFLNNKIKKAKYSTTADEFKDCYKTLMYGCKHKFSSLYEEKIKDIKEGDKMTYGGYVYKPNEYANIDYDYPKSNPEDIKEKIEKLKNEQKAMDEYQVKHPEFFDKKNNMKNIINYKFDKENRNEIIKKLEEAIPISEKWNNKNLFNADKYKLSKNTFNEIENAFKNISNDELLKFLNNESTVFMFPNSLKLSDETKKELRDKARKWRLKNSFGDDMADVFVDKLLRDYIHSKKESTTENKTLSDVRKKYETSKSVQGNKKTVTLPNGEKIKCHYKLVEADAPTASHDEKTFAKTDGFPTNKDGSTINDRDYAQDKDAQMSVIEIAQKYGSQALEQPPIVTKDGIVLSGNNRTMSSKLAAKNGTDKAYLDDLKEQIDEFGIDEDELKGFKHPRIILEIDEEHKGDYTTQEMAKYNETGMKTQNTTEKAVKMAKTLTNDSISDIAQSISGCNTLGELYNDEDAVEDFIGRLVKNGILTNQNKAEYVSNGKLSDAGKEFVETVLCGTILNESNIRQMNSEGGRAIRKKIIRALVPLAENKGNGNEYSINKELNQAVEIALRVAKNHNQYKDVQSFITTKDMFDDSETSDLVIKFAEDVHDLGEKNFADKMKSLQAGLRESSNGGINLFLDGCETKEQVLNRVFELKKSIQNILNSLFNRS